MKFDDNYLPVRGRTRGFKMLQPPPWQSIEGQQVWNGRFVVLLQGTFRATNCLFLMFLVFVNYNGRRPVRIALRVYSCDMSIVLSTRTGAKIVRLGPSSRETSSRYPRTLCVEDPQPSTHGSTVARYLWQTQPSGFLAFGGTSHAQPFPCTSDGQS